MSKSGRIGSTRGNMTALLAVLTAAGCVAASVARAAPAIAQADPVVAQRTGAEPYRIAPGDELSVSFPYNPELDHAGPVGPDGRFALPLVGNLALAGLSIDEVAALISADLRRHGMVEDARPTIAIRQYGAVIYVGGEVKQPGPVRLTQAMDPLQAVISAGGTLDTARTRQIVIIHRAADGAILKRRADLRDYVHRGVATGIALQPQDIGFVPRSSIAEADLWVDQHLNKLLPFSRSLNYNLGSAVLGR